MKVSKLVVLVGVLSLMLVLGGTAFAADYSAPKVDAPLELGADWSVDPEAAYSATLDDAGWNVWVLWDDSNVYLQYDVTTDFPMGNTHSEHAIWNADSIEFEIQSGSVKEKWIIGLTNNGYEVVTRQPRTIITPGSGVEVLIVETDNGYRGQVIFDQAHPHMAKFNITAGLEIDMAVQVNDSADGTTRTRIIGGFIDAGNYSKLVFVD